MTVMTVLTKACNLLQPETEVPLLADALIRQLAKMMNFTLIIRQQQEENISGTCSAGQLPHESCYFWIIRPLYELGVHENIL